MNKFKEGDTLLIRCEIEEVDMDGVAYVQCDSCEKDDPNYLPRLNVLTLDELRHAVKYDPDLPLPGQKVWVKDNHDTEDWKGPFSYIGKDTSDMYEYLVEKNNGFPGHYNYITTKNPHTEVRFTLSAMQKCFEESRKTNSMIGFKYPTFEDFLKDTNIEGMLNANNKTS